MSTASALEREIECPASAVLSPRVHESSEDAERGSALHHFARSVIAGTPRDLALAAVPKAEWRETAEQIDFGILCGGVLKVRAEVAYRIDIDTEEVTELGVNLNRRYPPRLPQHVDGTNDFEGFTLSGAPTFTDLKFGFWPVTRCAVHPQMLYHAWAQMRRHDADKVVGRIAQIDVGGVIRFDEATFTRFDVDTFADRVRERRARIARASEAIKAGTVEVHADERWCRYCPAKVGCPKYTALARAMLADLRLLEANWGTLTEEQKAAAYLQAQDAKDISTRVVEAIKDLARGGMAIPLGAGKELRETSSGVRVMNAEKAPRRRRVA